jgi:predicted RNA-binding protein
MSNSHDWKLGTYINPLINEINQTINKWESDRKESWQSYSALQGICSELAEELDEIDEPFTASEAFERIEQFADAITTSARYIDKHSYLDDIGHSGEDYKSYPDFIGFVEEKIEITLAKEVIHKIKTAAQRLVNLENDLTAYGRLKLSKNLKNFIEIVIQSYIWGYDAQCIIICRSAMENALRSAIDYETLIKHFGTNSKGTFFSLTDFIAAAKKENIIRERNAKNANTVRTRANAILHKDPRLTEDTEWIIFHTTDIISEIEGNNPIHTIDLF